MGFDIDSFKSNKSIQELLDFSIVNLDKPTGPTSFTIDVELKKLFNVSRTGHFGTLDPGVGGVLPVALGRACKLADYFAKQDKTYVGVMRLHKETDDKELADAVSTLIGKIKQKPPVRSSVKRVEREREVYTFEIIERVGKDVLFKAHVEAGTYIRTLVHDLGKLIGGANMIELRRTQASIFNEKDSVTLYEIEKAFSNYKLGNERLLRDILIPGEIVATVLPTVEIKEEYVEKCLQGSPIFLKFIKKNKSLENGPCCITSRGKLIGCYNIVNKGEMFAVPEFVLN